MKQRERRIINAGGLRRVVVTKELPGDRWVKVLVDSGCRVEVVGGERILCSSEIVASFEPRADAVIGQLTEGWSRDVLAELRAAGGQIYSQYAVGVDNVDVKSATELRLPVGNTPGVLTRATAELAVALTFAAARRVVEGDNLMRSGGYGGWLPCLLVGSLLHHRTLGIIGAGRIGSAYAEMMVRGHEMDLVYFDLEPNHALEASVSAFGSLLEAQGRRAVTCRRAGSVDEVMESSDVVSVHAALTPETRHMVGARELGRMKENAILVNAGRGPLIDEAALVEHCRRNPGFRVGLDVYEDEPQMSDGLADLENVVLVPHLGSATTWSREGMATLAALNVVAILSGWPAWPRVDEDGAMDVFLSGQESPKAAPSIVNAGELGLPILSAGAS